MDNEMKKHTPVAPFAYDTDYYYCHDVDEPNRREFTSLMVQRDAKYKKTAQETYVGTGLVEGDGLVRESFFLNIEPPTPQIMEIDGYSPEEEESSEDEGQNEGNDNANQDNGCEETNNTQTDSSNDNENTVVEGNP